MMDIAYAFDANGLRISKKAGTVEHKYFYDGGNLVSEVVGSTSLRFAYDENGLLSALTYNNGTTSNRYFYVRDILLNIIGLKDVLGNLVVRYNYDAWGNILSVSGSEASTVGQANPFRYKGYYYDSETMMYYCQSRYYVPEWCRWLNADDPNYLQFDSPKGANLFEYCGNNPVNKADPSGHIVISIFLLIMGFALGATIGAASSIITQGLTNGWDNINGWQVLLDSSIGGLSGLLAFSGIGALGSALISAGLGFTGSVGGDLISSGGNWEEVNWIKAGVMAGMNFILGWGSGVQNSKAITNSFTRALAEDTGYKAIKTALANPNISARGFQGVLNLYGGSLVKTMSGALTNIMVNRVTNGVIGTLSIAVVSIIFDLGSDYLGFWN